MTTKIIVSAVAAALVISAAAYAHNGATGVVKERMDAMSTLGKATKSLTEIMRGDVSYDAEVVRKNAAQIQKHAGNSMTKLFPEDSLMKPSEARPTIWANWEEFEVLAMRLETLAVGLAASADNGLMASGGAPASGMMGTDSMTSSGGMTSSGTMMAGSMTTESGTLPDAAELASMPTDGVFNMLAQTCASCHTQFRSEKN
ncbi:cytochrome c [Pararhizobium sp. IMCC21322]|uniref:c-type cytochrome n=1 Tax=Pararhizobium sp. IMCC21322 TaxID=3067903 RepID=UPI0027424D47|nr:cytochrome c [Pararhizobium sp. IMCC21322]